MSTTLKCPGRRSPSSRRNGMNSASGLAKLQRISTTRHLQIWHNNSTLANTGHIIFTVNCLCDPAIYMMDEEYKEEAGNVANVQAEVEKPHVHIVARCRSCDAEQLAYVETCLFCLQHLQRSIKTIACDCVSIMKGLATTVMSLREPNNLYFALFHTIHL